MMLVIPVVFYSPLNSPPPVYHNENSLPPYSEYMLRFSIIFTGLLITIIALIITIISLFFKQHKAADKLANLSMLVFIFVAGWIALPYWVNGLYVVFVHGTSSAFEPQYLLPMSIIGEIWRIPVLVLYPLILIYLVFSFIRFVVMVIKYYRPKAKNLLILLFNILIIVAWFFVPHYFYWLLC